MEVKREFENIWTACMARIEDKIKDSAVISYFFYDTNIISIDKDLVTICTSNSFAAQVLNKKYLDQIKEALYEVTQTNYNCIAVDKTSIKAVETTVMPSPKAFTSNLNSKYTFDNYVIGESNREVYTAAYATAMDPGKYFNPLFIYGKSGLGKTHLIHAIGNYVRENNPNAKVLYKSVDDFIEDVVKAFKDTGIEQLKDLYREVDVLLLDDVQFLTTKEKSKEVLFSIFNNLQNAGKQIILTSDRPVSELKNLEDRLVGRFSQGLSVEIKNLDYDLAYKILKKKIEVMDIGKDDIQEDVIEYLAKNYSTDVRRLEGALNKIMFYAIQFSNNSKIDMSVIHTTFEPLSKKNEEQITIEKIMTVVSEYYSISISQLKSKQRTANIAVARHIAMYLCRTLINSSLNEIGDAFGGKDHTTVMNAVEKVDKLLKTDENYLAAISELKNLLKS